MITIKADANQDLKKLFATLNNLKPDQPTMSQIVRTVAFDVLADMTPRIIERGGAADGSNIGSYSKKPIYISVKNNPVRSFGQPLGKRFNGKSRSIFASGKKAGQSHTSRYFERGYDEYKTKVGRNIGSVNLRLSGQMMNSFTVFKTSRGYGLGWNNKKLLERAEHFENKYSKPIFAMTVRERAIMNRTANKMLNDAISK